jgi:hypothetical protein
MTLKIAAHSKSHAPAAHSASKPPSIAQIKTVITKAYMTEDRWFNFPSKLALKSVPHALLDTPLARAFKKNSTNKSSEYDYSTLNKLNLDGKTVYALESVTDDVDDLRVFGDKGQPLVSNIDGGWSK